MMKSVCLVVVFALICISSESRLTIVKPQPNPDFKINSTDEDANKCKFRVEITTSCSSTRYPRDQISLAFGDAYGKQVYASGLNERLPWDFNRCSIATFEVYGQCPYKICYFYLYRSGDDGWKPESVLISGLTTVDIPIVYDVWIPANVWYGFDFCEHIRMKHRFNLYHSPE